MRKMMPTKNSPSVSIIKKLHLAASRSQEDESSRSTDALPQNICFCREMALRRKKSGKRLTLAFGRPCVTCYFLRCQEKLSFVFRSGERKLKTIWVHLVKGVKLGNSRQWNYIASFSGKTGSALIYGLKLIGVRPPPSSSPKRQVLLALLKLPRDCKIWKWVRKDECNSSLAWF